MKPRVESSRSGGEVSCRRWERAESFGLLFLSLFLVFATVGYIYLLRLPVSCFCSAGVVAMLSGFMAEFAFALALCFLFLEMKRVGIFMAYLVLGCFVAFNLVQLGSIYYCGSFLPRLAIENLEFIGLFLSPSNVAYAVLLIVLFLGVPGVASFLLLKRVESWVTRLLRRSLHTGIALLVLAGLFFTTNFWLPHSVVGQGKACLAQSGVEEFRPTWCLFKTLVGPRKRDVKKAELKKEEIKKLQKRFGFRINPLNRYPLVKNTIYWGACPLQKRDVDKPNLIVIFTEGTSARTLGPYNPKFKDVTPNLNVFAQNSTVVLNYFNHTTATYRGLLGQTCSFYPRFGGVGGWRNNYKNLPRTSYCSLADLFERYGYDTLFLGAETKAAAHTHDMMRVLGFKKVLTAEDLSKRYLGGAPFAKEWGLSDQQMYRVLRGFLEERVRLGNNKPFLLAIYTEETHAWLDVGLDGVKYGDGKSNTLNTLHNLDDAFGGFWRFFKNSPLANNTIVVFTADHAHFQEKSYVALMKKMGEKDYRPIFVDRVPLIIHDPVHKLPPRIDAHGATSLDLAPTLVHLLCLPNQENAFLGTSIFTMMEEKRWPMGVTWYNDKLFVVDHKGVHGAWSTEKTYRKARKLARRFITYLHSLEVDDRIWPVKHPERWERTLSQRERIKRVLETLSPATGERLVWPEYEAEVKFNEMKGLSGMVLFVWRADSLADAYSLKLTLDAHNGTSKSWDLVLSKGDSRLIQVKRPPLVASFFSFTSHKSWNALSPYEIRWRVVALNDRGEPLWESEERWFRLKPTGNEAERRE